MNSKQREQIRGLLESVGCAPWLKPEMDYQEPLEENIFALTNGEETLDDKLFDEVKSHYLMWQLIAQADLDKVLSLLKIYKLPYSFNPNTGYERYYYRDVLSIIGCEKRITAPMIEKIKQSHDYWSDKSEESWKDSREDEEIIIGLRNSYETY